MKLNFHKLHPKIKANIGLNPRAFISYSHKDSLIARQLEVCLDSIKTNVFIDYITIALGEYFNKKRNR